MRVRPALLLLAAAGGVLTFQPVAHAAYMLTIRQNGSNVVASGSGSINTSGLSNIGSTSWSAILAPSWGGVSVGSGYSASFYSGLTGPGSFGAGTATPTATSASGSLVGVVGGYQMLELPTNYVSGTALSGTATWANTSFASLGLTPGTYTWSWGSGSGSTFTMDNFTVTVVNAPEPASIALLALPAAYLLVRRKRPASGS